jgi:outer membrane protein OmpA-like peptidoglycan-associated protein
MKKITYLMALLLFAASTSLLAFTPENETRMRVGVYGGLNINMHSPSFTYTDTSDINNPFEFLFNENKNSFGGNFGVLVDFILQSDDIISARLGYNGMGVDFERSFTDVDNIITTNDKLETSLNYIEIAGFYKNYSWIPVENLHTMLGVEFGFPVGSSYTLTRTVTPDPPNMPEFANNTDLPTSPIRFALALGVGYDIKLADRVTLNPELTFRLPLTKVSGDNNFDSWSVPQLRLQVNLIYDLFSSDQAPEDPQPYLKVGFDEVRYYDNDGNTHPIENVRVEDIQYTELFPFIPYVFYDKQKATPLPTAQAAEGKYQAGSFSLNNVDPDAMQINNHTLDIVGMRMQQDPKTAITIIGTVDGVDEKADEDLSLKRAEFAKKYLVDNFDINPQRINVRGGGKPANASTSNVPEGMEENRRIEIISSNKSLLEPILIEKENQRIPEPNVIEFLPTAETSDTVIAWKLEISQAGEVLRKFTGNSAIEPIQWVIIPNELKNSDLPIEYSFWAESLGGVDDVETGTIPVEYYSITRKQSEELPDKTISKYSLMLFDFDKAEVSEKDMEIINKYIVPEINFNSVVKIYGYTDNIGDATYNEKLAKKRADAVKNVLKTKVPKANYEAFGVGEKVEIFDNDSPVGRHLSRTVQIYVITPKN